MTGQGRNRIAAPSAYHFGTRSLANYWFHFLLISVLGAILLIWMCREMFGELY
jgi:uncharacterized membrane protein YeaQ/YmgE (transglycosylase-associated protein family)